ncbi:type III secretion protein, partial [Xanthomonas citri]|nr:type III secretion protein [Xanthomonas citri]
MGRIERVLPKIGSDHGDIVGNVAAELRSGRPLARTGHPPGELQLDRWAVDPGTGALPGDQDAMFEEAGLAHPFSSKQNTSFSSPI